MSVHDKGYGGNAGLEFESDFTNRTRSANAPDAWGTNAPPGREGPLMSGAGRPGQPIPGQPKPGQPAPGQPLMSQQRSIFGTGRGPVFAQMPAYTPVTRGPAPAAPRAPEPPRQDFGTYARPQSEPRPNPPSVSGYSNGTPPQPYPSRGTAADYAARPRETYQPQTYPSQGYSTLPQPGQTRAESAFPSQYAADPYASCGGLQTHTAAPQPNAFRDTSFTPAANPNLSDAKFPDRIFPESTYASSSEASFAETNFAGTSLSDASLSESRYAEPMGQGSDFAGQSYGDASFPDAGFADASFPETQDASFGASDLGQGLAQQVMPQGEPESLHLEAPTYGADADYGYAAPQGKMAQPLPSHQALQAFDAPYDQPPHIALGPTELPPQQNFYEGEQADADFLDESQLAPAEIVADQSRKFGMGRRSIVMVSSALLGAVALGGALAFAYKQSGGSVDGAPPLVQADSSPVKQAPADPGGKEFPNKNKLIYERLQNGDQPEAERIVPRQEELAMPAMPGGEQTAGLPAGAAPMAAPGVAAVEDPSGGPRRVKTLVVRPDGSVEGPPASEAAPPMAEPAMPPAPQQMAAATASDQMAAAPAAPVPVTLPAPVPAAAPAPAADPQPVAAIPAPAPAPAAAPAPPPAQAAPAPAPAQAAPAAPSKYVVQVSSKQNQTEALATFADMQQKYPALLAPYRPLVQKADLGSKGVWYRLQIGPMTSKSTASKLCEDLKSQGLPECLVVAAQ